MTAVANPSDFQPLPRWSNVDGQGLGSMSADEVSRMFQPRKVPQRKDSSSSMASSSSASSTSTASTALTAPLAPSLMNGDAPAANGDTGGWGPRKKPPRGLWPVSKAEPVSGITTARSQPLPTPSSGQVAASTISAMHQPSPILPSQNRMQSQGQNGARTAASNQAESNPVLVLLPLTGTFERKHITVPYAPEVLRIGRQTNVKTVPTPVNGYFDSKVLSRQHAEVWATPEGKIMIRDVKSSNGTFVNGFRLSPENRESDPNALNEGDILELGIDIVSEDQKSIVHHKVSARVEFAGIYGSGSNVLDLNFGDMDAGSGNGISPANGQQMSRGRGSSQGSTGNNRASGMNGNNANAIAPQRQMNLWLNPITIEQVVKKLSTELKVARQQSQDLHRTGEFFNTLLSLEPGQEPPQPPPGHQNKRLSQPSGISPSAIVNPSSPFSQPPAPPPQQPLPEKPDSAALPFLDPALSRGDLKRTDTERPLSAMNSPTRQEPPPSSQILSLVEALSTAKREIDSQGDRVRQLETLLTRERKARESAEEKARRLLEGHFPDTANGHIDSTVDEDAFEPPLDTAEALDRGLTDSHYNASDNDDPNSETSSMTTILPSLSPTKSSKDLQSENKASDASTTRLKERLDLMVREMDEMKSTMEIYKRRAEGAEEERNSLQEMIAKIRATKTNGAATSPNPNPSSPSSDSSPSSASSISPFSAHSPSSSQTSNMLTRANGSASSVISNAIPDFKDLERTVTSVLQQSQQGQGQRGSVAMQSAPYASMVGVVLIGLGIMTWLNGWQKVER